jgi:hypothetical protein
LLPREHGVATHIAGWGLHRVEPSEKQEPSRDQSEEQPSFSWKICLEWLTVAQRIETAGRGDSARRDRGQGAMFWDVTTACERDRPARAIDERS